MNTIQQQSLKTYQKNLNFFKTNASYIFEKITTFSHALSQGLYNEKYALEYRDTGYFDIKELSSNQWFYGQNPNHHATQLTNLINTDKSTATFEAERYVDYNRDEIVDIIDQSKLSFNNDLWATIKIIDY